MMVDQLELLLVASLVASKVVHWVFSMVDLKVVSSVALMAEQLVSSKVD
jgi:hypothetical protein